MSGYRRAADRVLVVLLAALIVGLSLFAFMQSVVDPLMGPPRSQQLTPGQSFVQGERPAPGRPENGEGGLPRRLRPRMFLGIFSRLVLFGLVTAFVVVLQRLFFTRRPRPPQRS